MKVPNLVIVVALGAILSLACVLTSDGTREFDPVRAHGEVGLVIEDLEAASETFPDEAFLVELTDSLEDLQDILEVYINGGGEGDALRTSLAAVQYLVDTYRDDEDYKVHALVIDIALRRIRASLPQE